MHQPVEMSERSRAMSWVPARWRGRRRMLFAAGIVVVLIIAGLFLGGVFSGASEAPKEAGNVPVVTVTVPGTTQVTDSVSATGNIAARHDMPVGVQGEGGAIVAVLVEAGDVVREGQVLARIDRSVQAQTVSSLAASLRQSRADAALAQSELDRALALVKRGFISKADIDRRTAARDSASARVAVAAAELREGQARLGRLDVRAPEGGVILERSVEPGQVVSAGGAPLFRIAKDGVFELQAKVAEQNLARMRVGMPAQVTPIGHNGTAVKGTIWQLSPIVDPQTRQGIARIELEKDANIRPGGFASVDIAIGTTTAPLLPESAVFSDANGKYVFVVGPDNKAKHVRVEVGDVTDRGISIRRGLNGTEQVVLSAGAFLNAGDTVKPQRAKL